jgi:thiol-disulfide isomerase/thioredoxin/outer membrane protein assembly factor BamD (BamD/ComL family)
VPMKTSRSLNLAVAFLLFATCLHGQQPALDTDFAHGQEALRARKYQDAISAFKKSEKQNHGACSECLLGMAFAYFHLGDKDNALKNSDKAIPLLTDDAHRATAHTLKGQAYLLIEPDPKSLQKAEAEFREAVKLTPSQPDFHLNLACALLKESKDEDAINELKQCLALNPAPSSADMAKKFLADPRRGREELAPDFALTTLQGHQISLKELAGKTVILDFWATWCPPCRASVPELKELTKKYPNDRLVLISISGDKDEKAWQEFVAKHEMSWSQFRDPDHKLGELFRVNGFPTYLVINGDGFIKARIVGQNPQETIVHHLKDLLASSAELSAKK